MDKRKIIACGYDWGRDNRGRFYFWWQFCTSWHDFERFKESLS